MNTKELLKYASDKTLSPKETLSIITDVEVSGIEYEIVEGFIRPEKYNLPIIKNSPNIRTIDLESLVEASKKLNQDIEGIDKLNYCYKLSDGVNSRALASIIERELAWRENALESKRVTNKELK